MRAEQITGPVATHGEGPVWWPAWGGLRFVDMMAGDVLHLDESTGEVRRRHVGVVAAAIRPRAQGGMVVATERDIAVTDDPDSDALPAVVATPFTDPTVRFNDGGCDPDGRFWCGSMAYSEEPGHGTLVRLAPDGTLSVVLEGVGISNGLAWSAEGTRVYYADTSTGRVDVFDYDEGGLHERRPFATIAADDGLPDGLAVDCEDGIWVALYAGGVVRHYDASGQLADVVELPVPRPTSCAFGGPGLQRLYITTTRRGDPGPPHQAGALFTVDAGVAGVPTRTFAG